VIDRIRVWFRRPAAEFGYVDPLLAALSVALMAFGVVMVYSSSAIEATVKLGDPEFYLRRQAAFAGISLVVMFLVSRIDYRKLRLLTYPIFVGTLVLLGLSLTGFGHSGGGATRWLQVGPVRIQPAEMAKLALILWLGYSLAKKADRVKKFSIGMVPHLAVLAIVMLMCLGQPDFGSAVVMAVITIVMLFVAGAKWRHLFAVIVVGVVGGAWAVQGKAYRLGRIDAWQNIIENRHGSAYQPFQSLMSFGSGEATGLGLGKGYQPLYLPEAHTDFISAIIGEELGFVGILLLCGAFFTIVVRGVRLSLTAPDEYSAYVAFGISCLFGIQVLINLMVAMTIAPTKGLTLPFISYGGSSLLVCAAAMGILLSISRHSSKVRAAPGETSGKSSARSRSPSRAREKAHAHAQGAV
jgi:cell division protein FtsW